ncbi:MAG: hypothetical protein EBX50_09625, partial [Chitinophagia bacterium]|nr:hypothetical protein [Chitinophagia bacterium]
SRALESIGAGADAAESPSIYLFNSRGTISSPTAVQNGDVGGEIVVFGHDGNDYETLGGISFVTNGAVSAGVIPSKISLSVGNYISSPGAIKTVEFDSTGAFKIAALSAAPASPVTGAVYVANGTGWDPATKGGVVPYPVFYDGVAFHPFY